VSAGAGPRDPGTVTEDPHARRARLDYRRTTAALRLVLAYGAWLAACTEYDQAEAAIVAQIEEMIV
jgi:hypothetical protein